MTQHEQDVFNQLDAEDQAVDYDRQNLDCKGTKRTGNVNFQGTKEHWLIQLDYIASNLIHGEMEFAIPNGSMTNPRNRGYADIVNTQNGHMFEIKPNNQTGLNNGIIEVNWYVNKANQSCLAALPAQTAWIAGTTYNNSAGAGNQPKYLPTNVPRYQ